MLRSSENSSSLNDSRTLEEEIGRMKDWDTEKARYALRQIDELAVVYAPKPTEAQTPHWLRANCFEDGQKSYLQAHAGQAAFNRRNWECRRCRAIVVVNGRTTPGS